MTPGLLSISWRRQGGVLLPGGLGERWRTHPCGRGPRHPRCPRRCQPPQARHDFGRSGPRRRWTEGLCGAAVRLGLSRTLPALVAEAVCREGRSPAGGGTRHGKRYDSGPVPLVRLGATRSWPVPDDGGTRVPAAGPTQGGPGSLPSAARTPRVAYACATLLLRVFAWGPLDAARHEVEDDHMVEEHGALGRAHSGAPERLPPQGLHPQGAAPRQSRPRHLGQGEADATA